MIIETGKVDIISNGHEEMYVDTDSPLFKINVGCGDMLTAVVGTFAAYEPILGTWAARQVSV